MAPIEQGPLPLHPAQATKIEALIQGMENLCIGVGACAARAVEGAAPHASVTKFLDEARVELRVALREFLLPAMRLAERGPRQGYEPGTSLEDQPICLQCNRHYICADTNCQYWGRALQVCASRVPPQQPGGDAA